MKDFIEKVLQKKHKTKDIAELRLYIDQLKTWGYEINQNFRPEAIKQIEDDIYELRPGSNRVLFFYHDKNGRFILLHGFEKKTNKTPISEKNRAISERNDYLRRNRNERDHF